MNDMLNTDFLAEKGASEIARIAGVTRQTATNWIQGKTKPPVDKIHKIASVYGVPVHVVYGTDYKDDKVAMLEAENKLLKAKISAIKALLEDGE